MFFINHTEIGEGSSAIIEIDGPLNSETTPDFDDYINNLVENNIIYLLIDMLNLKFISSEGIGAVLMIQKNINDRNGLAVFFNLNYETASLFKLLGFDKVFTIAEDRADAVNILDRHMELSPPGTPSRESSKISGNSRSFFDDEPALSEPVIPGPETFEIPESFDLAEDIIPAFEPFVIECVKCRSLIRIKESGDQLCPFCETGFTVDDEKKAVFRIKEIRS